MSGNKSRRRFTTAAGVVITERDRMLKPPPGCIDVWQIAYRNRGSGVWLYAGIMKDFDLCVAYADHLKLLDCDDRVFYVNHKAAIDLGNGHYYLVHFNPINFKTLDPLVLQKLEEQLHGHQCPATSQLAPSDLYAHQARGTGYPCEPGGTEEADGDLPY